MNETNTARNAVTWTGDSVSAVCELDGVKVNWIRDNVQERLMPITLFPDAGKNLIDSLSLQGGNSLYHEYLLGRIGRQANLVRYGDGG